MSVLRASRLLLLLLPLVPWVGAPAQAAPASCARAGMTTYTWDGGANTDQWVDDLNWSGNEAPGFDGSSDVLVCLPTDAEVVLVHADDDAQGHAVVDTLDLAPGARLTVAVSGRLYLNGTGDRQSVVRRDATAAAVLRLSGTLGGHGTLVVNGRLDWVKTPDGGTTMTTRHCAVFTGKACGPGEPPEDQPVTVPGRTVVGPRGQLLVSGPGGVNLVDRRVVEVHGLLRISGTWVAADDATTIDVASDDTAVLQLLGQADVFQGKAYFGMPPALVRLAGTTVRSGATATSIIDARVAVASGAASRVETGFLSLGGAATPAALVRYGATYGVGRCAGTALALCGSPVATPGDRQTVAVTLPTTATGRVPVSLRELAGEQKAGDLAAPVRIHVGALKVSAARPMRFALRLDAAAVGARTPGSLRLWRRADGTATYREILPCRADGTPRSGAKACIRARTLLSDGDVRVLVHSQVNSRWKVR